MHQVCQTYSPTDRIPDVGMMIQIDETVLQVYFWLEVECKTFVMYSMMQHLRQAQK